VLSVCTNTAPPGLAGLDAVAKAGVAAVATAAAATAVTAATRIDFLTGTPRTMGDFAVSPLQSRLPGSRYTVRSGELLHQVEVIVAAGGGVEGADLLIEALGQAGVGAPGG